MAFLTLGLDLGISSVGWALTEQSGSDDVELKAWGSRIFEPGMDDDIESGKGVSRCSIRRLKRALRIQYKRRKDRKDLLIKALTEAGMFPDPLTPDFFTSVDSELLRCFPEKATRRQIGHVLPYLLRKMALDRPLSAKELGRCIYHLAQRRGYLSNRKQDLKNEEFGQVKSGIESLKKQMADAHARTIGEYFSMLDPEQERIRGRYTDRAMYEQEFRMICAKQRALVSEELEKKLYRIIFFQRKLKSCKGLIGKCSIYPDEFRCSFAEEEAQLFRIYTTVNHLRIEKDGVIRPLVEDERKKVIDCLNGFSNLMNSRGRIALSKLAKGISLAKGENFTLADDEKEIYGNELHASLYHVFGEKAKELSPEDRCKFFHDIVSIEKDDILNKRLTDFWKLSAVQTETAMKIVLPDTYCAFSRKALREILPGLEAGIPLNTIEKVSRKSQQDVLEFLPVFDSQECGIDVRNPVVHRVMTELRKVVNSIIARYGKPNAIRIELARNLKSTNKERESMTIQNRQREKERMAIAEKIAREAGIERPSRNDILKVMLAEECDYTCPYTGIKFSMTELLHGKNIHIEHIIPYSRSFDDSFRNKTLCEAAANAAKNNMTPYEAFSGSPEYDQMITRVSHFRGPYMAYKKDLFTMKQVDSQKFLDRNLNDTRYATKLAMKYLSFLYGGIADHAGTQRIFASSGGHTALIRRAWGGNYLLGEGEKTRADHRHHAVDALTIALTTPEMVKVIASMSPDERRKKHDDLTPLVCTPLFEQAKNMLDKAVVSHHVTNKIRGALHKETIYGKDYGNNARHIRCALPDLTAKDFMNVVDPAIQKLILQQLGKSDPSQVSDKDFKVFQDENMLPVLKDRSGNVVNRIKSVRVVRNVTTRTIGTGDGQRDVANGANYLLAVFAKLDSDGNETGWTGEIVSLLDARQRHQKHQPLFSKEKPGLKFKFTLKKGDIVSWQKDGKEIQCIIRGVSLPQFSMAPIRDARMKKDLQAAKVWFTPTLSAAFQGHMKKYTMNIFGETQEAYD